MSPVVSRTVAQRHSHTLLPLAVGSSMTDATCLSTTFPTGVLILKFLELQSEKANQIKWLISDCVW
jgi:hypothetical protein